MPITGIAMMLKTIFDIGVFSVGIFISHFIILSTIHNGNAKMETDSIKQ